MASKDGERSASSATRFTATTPHASSKAGSSRFPPAPGAGGPRTPASPIGGSIPHGETPEQRVSRLRAAHEKAKDAKVSRFDQILAKSRPFFDSAHRITVLSLVGLTAVATLLTAYTAYDMLRYNRKRKAEFLDIQRKMGADSLEAARLAYMRGDATEDQISQVEEANSRAGGAGAETFKLPSILSAPKAISRDDEPPAASGAGESVPGENKSSGVFGWFSSSGSKKDEGGDSTSRDAPRTLEDKQDMLRKAREAFEKEKENQRVGGPLDRVGTDATTTGSIRTNDAEKPKKKGWLW